MRRYETIIIVDPDIAEDARKALFDKIIALIPQQDGFLVAMEEWGAQKLAYEIKKKARGYYVRFDFCGLGPLVDELERSLRIDDRVMKYMTIVLDKTADLEAIKAGLAPAAQEAAQEAAPEEIIADENTTTETADATGDDAAAAAPIE